MNGRDVSLLMGLLVAIGCGGTSMPGMDGGGGQDGGGQDGGGATPDAQSAAVCPTGAPLASEQTLPCCYRRSNADQLAAPEMRLTFVDIVEPADSNLSGATIRGALNTSIRDEEFNWLLRMEGGAADGPVTIVTGYGLRTSDVAPSTYAFSGPPNPDRWNPVSIPATLAGEMVSSNVLEGSITVPVLDENGVDVQLELVLRSLQILEATMTEQRSCIGTKVGGAPQRFDPAGRLAAFIEVAPSRTGVISLPGLTTSVCSAVAGDLTATYCDRPQSEWRVKPDSLCDATSCAQNTPGMMDVCDPDTTCNAWYLVAEFAAAGVEITN